MSDRDTLTGLLHAIVGIDLCAAREGAERLLRTGWRPPARVIETTEKRDAVQNGAIVRDRWGDVCVRDGDDYLEPGNEVSGPWRCIALPAVVLWEPEQEAQR
ncbi:hypothetical protein [Nocardia cyriacigeorgica]|uniref:Uncharacterized protein n=1 Tax=Nocardia cyriacigeorgica TaxID=135487 RepID=A0A5R8NB87_9NOCA|nr:hypothetical protein [Nocardia cyriacigeorgica]TLF72896.1 hypothetical protein FEK34_28140 [Nocardia cyriacigeorgica]